MTGGEPSAPGGEELLRAANLARQNAHAPYSKYKVGAAVRTASGRVFSGANVENASYGLTVCAERSAVFAAVSAGETSLTEVVVVTENGASPCGACRQVLAEFGTPDVPVRMAAPDGSGETLTLGELLPRGFVFES